MTDGTEVAEEYQAVQRLRRELEKAQARALAALRHYREITAARDELILAAHEAGLKVTRISQASGISRNTMYQIIQKQEGGKPANRTVNTKKRRNATGRNK